MNRELLLTRLESWMQQHASVQSLHEELRGLFQLTPESRVSTVLWDGFKAYTANLAALIGLPDTDWLDWYVWENGCGRHNASVKFLHWPESRRISSDLNDLADLIEAVLSTQH